jgi:putative transposase
MEQITITAKIQVSASISDKLLLDKTMSVYRDTCNYVSDYVFRTHDLKQFSLNKVMYSDLREKIGS